MRRWLGVAAALVVAAGCLGGSAPQEGAVSTVRFVASALYADSSQFYSDDVWGENHTRDRVVRTVPDFEAPSATGEKRAWIAVLSHQRLDYPPLSPEFLLLDPATGCPAATGSQDSWPIREASNDPSAWRTRRSVEPLLEDVITDWAFLAEPHVAMVLGALVRLDPDHAAKAFAAPKSSVQIEVDSASARVVVNWTSAGDPPSVHLEFRYTDARDDPYPDRVAWTRFEGTEPQRRGLLVRQSLQYAEARHPLGCGATLGEVDRLPSTSWALPLADPFPPGYSMAEAYVDFGRDLDVALWLLDHAGARIVWAEGNAFPPYPGLVPVEEPWRTVQWSFELVDPSDGARIRGATYRMFFDNGVVAPGQTSSYESFPVEGFPTDAPWKEPLVSLADVIAAAKADGMPDPNGVEWLESHVGSTHVAWTLRHEAEDRGAVTSYRLAEITVNAQTGLAESAVAFVPTELGETQSL